MRTRIAIALTIGVSLSCSPAGSAPQGPSKLPLGEIR